MILEQKPAIICHAHIQNAFYCAEIKKFCSNIEKATVYENADKRENAQAEIKKAFPKSKRSDLIYHFIS